MWSSVLVLALVTAADPGRLIATFLVITRPRPVQNLLAYLAGCWIVNAAILLFPLLLLHFVPVLRTTLEGLTGTPTEGGGSGVQPVPVGMGVVALVVATILTVRLKVRQRSEVPAVDVQPAMVLEPSAASESSATFAAEQTAAGNESVVKRLAGRMSNAWSSGALWVSLVMGLTYSPAQVSIALAIIAASGATIGSQLSAALAFVVIMLAISEIILVSCVLAPARTQQVLEPLHDWVRSHRMQVAAGVFFLVGVSLVVTGMGIV